MEQTESTQNIYIKIYNDQDETNINALRYCNKVRESGRQAWVDSNVCYYI